ncbi:lipase secretion chaperone [Leptospira ilyithenensis]|uniref:Lipase helper protein n=1 Tax=Leptospira ilyithenensis TaxID=2484901 RepID=A0A4R9LNR2_9LEPT|nr:lipase secretion chaperone [Leptospira ilyithenensis]TGN10478.1 lipase [Leptospira ilyithenensis]
MNRKIVLSIGIALLFLAFYLFYRLFTQAQIATSSERSENDKAKSYFSQASDGFEVDSFYLESSKNLFQSDGGFLRFDEIMARARTGEINLVSELWTLRRQCPEGSTREQCNEYVKAFLKNEYSGDEANKLISLLNSYLRYEEAMSHYELPANASNEEKYELVKTFRRTFFSRDDADFVFGLEEATADFSFNRRKFLDETKNVSGDERMRQYENYRKKTFGDYYDSVSAREPKFDRYETELELRNNELAKLDPTAKESKEREVRTRYFGKDGNDRMEKVTRELKQEEEKENQLAKEEAEFLRKNPNLKGDEKNRKLMELRTQVLGSKESAEEYSRRKQYETEMKNLSE